MTGRVDSSLKEVITSSTAQQHRAMKKRDGRDCGRITLIAKNSRQSKKYTWEQNESAIMNEKPDDLWAKAEKVVCISDGKLDGLPTASSVDGSGNRSCPLTDHGQSHRIQVAKTEKVRDGAAGVDDEALRAHLPATNCTRESSLQTQRTIVVDITPNPHYVNLVIGC
ncbi:unnamed protein product [Schistocephalus solidus]|uniref:Uncharacterized protein n=1 Tax=Schistocephalus solidus TaxID=70667 RepID=A0A183SNX5_SCHSO|nr:unnamed protein product [Schistocephalus solidus]